MVKNLKKYISISFFLLAVLLFGSEGNITDFGSRLNLVIGICFSALFYLLHFPSDANFNLKLRLIIHNVLFIILLSLFPAISRIPLFVVSTLVFYIILNKKNHNYSEIIILALSALIFSLYLMIYQYSSGMWYVIQNSSQGLSDFSSIIISNPINSNSSYTGIHISIFFLMIAGCFFWFSSSKRFSRLILSLVYVAVLTVIYIIIQYYFSKWSMHNMHSFYVHSLHSQALLFILLIPLIFYLSSKTKFKDAHYLKGEFNLKSWGKVGVFLMLFFSILILTFLPYTDSENKNILFYDKGYLDWRLPDHNNYGAKNGGMFGLLPIYLEANNYLLHHDSTINNQNLSETDILIVINLLEEFSNEEKQLIWNFVDQGGALFVLGDHTGFKQIREPTNKLLEPFNIELNFDCALPFVESWRNSMNYFPHPITTSVSSNYESNIFIGASLTIGPQSRPLIIGKFGFSDPGDLNASRNAYLGDMRYTQGEQLGDQVLVAEAFYGKGKVLVFGDTSPFQNSALVQSHTFVNKVFNWLSSPLNWWYKYSILIFFILMTLAFIAMLRMKFNLYDYLIISIVICIGAFINTSAIIVNRNTKTLKTLEKKLAIINASNMERFSLDQWKGNGYGGLTYNLMRADYIPILNASEISENINDSKMLVLIAPAKPFKHSEILILDNYVRNGGFLIITSGWEESYGSDKLLENFGLSIENIPLGKIDSDQNKNNISFTKAWALSSSDENYNILCEVWNYPIIIFKSIGKGGIFLIGDSEFLLNDNLEGMESYNRQNILFFKQMIEKYTNEK